MKRKKKWKDSFKELNLKTKELLISSKNKSKDWKMKILNLSSIMTSFSRILKNLRNNIKANRNHIEKKYLKDKYGKMFITI